MPRPNGVGTDLLCHDCASSIDNFPEYHKDRVGKVRCEECDKFLNHLKSLSNRELESELVREWPSDVQFSTFCSEYTRRGLRMPA